METVKIESSIRSTIERVWEAMVDVRSFPKFMNAVRDTEVLASADGERTVAWSVLLRGCVLKWTERAIVDETLHTVSFVQIDGDLERFEGVWRAADGGDGTVAVTLEATFEIGVPLLDDMLAPVAADALRESQEEILRSIGERASS